MSFRSESDDPSRRGFLAAGLTSALAAAAGQAQKESDFDLAETTIADLQAAMTTGKATARSLVAKYLDRIESVDRNGPKLASIVELNPDALSVADALDAERKAKGPRGPLHGIPVLVPDTLATSDKMETAAGSLALVGVKPANEAGVIDRFRKAGVVILGKTNVSEWGNARSSYATQGWSARGGLTKNPYVLDRSAGGACAGSAAAVAANLCAAALGTETDGSLTAPASVNGVVGLKPTVGLVSRTGLLPAAGSFDTPGIVTRSIRDAAVLLNALAGTDPADPTTADADRKRMKDYTAALVDDGLKGAKLGVAYHYFGFHDAVDGLGVDGLEMLKKLGAKLFEAADLPSPDAYSAAEATVLQYELKAGLNEYLAAMPAGAKVKSLTELVAFNDKNATKEQPYFGQDLLRKADERGPLTSYEYVESLAKCRRITRTEGLDTVLESMNLDAVVGVTLGPACRADLVLGDRWLGGDLMSVAAVAGYPHLTVPLGQIFGLPVGLSFVGRRWSEPALLLMAFAFEQGMKARKPPKFLPTVAFG
jgi:amidase